MRTSYSLHNTLKAHKLIQNENKLKYGPYYEKNIFNSKDCDFIMTWENGKYLHPDYYTSKFKKVTKRANIEKKVRFHDLRHTNATLMLQEGVNYKIIQNRLGHADINTTLNIYAHVDLEMQKSATEKLNKIFNNNLGGRMVEESKNHSPEVSDINMRLSL